jgi:glycosyltransferase involved in cell wall biosynthesis
MKILAVVFCPPFGAISDLFIGIVNGISQKENVNLSVLCPENLNLGGIKTAQIHRIKYDKKKPFLLLSKSSLDIIYRILREKFDVVLFYTPNILNLPLSIMMRNINQVVWWHEPSRRGRTTLLNYLIHVPHDYQLTKQAHKIIVACEAMKEMVPEHLKHKLVVIPLPSSLLSNSLIDYTNDSMMNPVNDFLFFGKIEKYKGLDILAQSMLHLCQQGYSPRLKVIGMGDMEKNCPQLIDFSKTHPQNIEIINSFGSEAEIVNSIRQSKVVVLPYLSATGTTTVQIAAQQHRPVIATCVGCFQNYIINDETGWLVPPNNFMSLSEVLKEVIKNTEKTRLMGENAYHNFNSKYTQEIVNNKLLDALQN